MTLRPTSSSSSKYEMNDDGVFDDSFNLIKLIQEAQQDVVSSLPTLKSDESLLLLSDQQEDLKKKKETEELPPKTKRQRTQAKPKPLTTSAPVLTATP